MTTITIERIKAALSALKPEIKKPWVTLDHLPYIHATDDTNAKPYSTPVVGRFDYMESADYIMSCNPAAMAEVLAHIDAQAAEIGLHAQELLAMEITLQNMREKHAQELRAYQITVDKLRAERKPMPDQELNDLAFQCGIQREDARDPGVEEFVRAVEAHHGIGDKP